MRVSWWLSTLLVLGFASCATQAPIPPLGSAIQRQGLVNWQWSDTQSLTADLAFVFSPSGDLDLTASKGSTLIELRRRGEEWSASGPVAAIPWRGTFENPPIRLIGWITLADTIFSIQNAPAHIDGWISGRVRARWTDDGSEIVVTDSGERFRVRWRGAAGSHRQ